MEEVHIEELKEYHTGTSKFDLTLGIDVNLASGGLDCNFEYATDLFDEVTVERLSKNFCTLLKEILENPNRSIESYSVISDDESDAINLWSGYTEAIRPTPSLSGIFDDIVKKYSRSTALSFNGTNITYAELHERSNQLGHILRSVGVGRDCCVAICLDPSIDYVLGILSIIKSGGAYVPLNSSFPRERLISMIEDTKTKFLLTDANHLDKLSFFEGTQILLEDLKSADFSLSANYLTQVNSSGDLAYVMFTSGSTGKPKGILICHSNIINLVKDQNYVAISETDAFGLMSNIAFDASTFEIWGPLLNGGKLVIPATKEVLFSTGSIKPFFVENRISIVFMTTGLLEQLLHEDPTFISSLKFLLFGGQMLSFDTPKFLMNSENLNVNICHVYGPTECTTFSTCYNMTQNYKDFERYVPIGKPLRNVLIYVLNEKMRRVPVGVIGELFIGGLGVSNGYLSSLQTNEKFIESPFLNSTRLYRTGDLVRLLEGMID